MAQEYPFIRLGRLASLSSALGAWIFFYLYLYYQWSLGTFTQTNPLVLYALPSFFLTIAAGAVGGNLYRFLFYKRDGTPIKRKEALIGIPLGLLVGGMLVFTLHFVSPAFASIGVPQSIMLYAVTPEAPLIINYVHPALSITNVFSNLGSLIFSSAALFYLIVALSEEFLVLVTFKLLEDSFGRGKATGVMVVIAGIALSSLLWSLAHVPAYTSEGIPLIFGITFAAVTGAIVFRWLSELIWHNMNFPFMVSSHFMYDFMLATTLIPFAFIPYHALL